HPRCAAQHHAFRFQPAHADRDHAKRIHVRRMAVGAHKRVGKGHAVDTMYNGGHPLQIDLVHDTVARWDHIDVAECLLGPLNEVEAIVVTPILDGAVFDEGVLLKTG